MRLLRAASLPGAARQPPCPQSARSNHKLKLNIIIMKRILFPFGFLAALAAGLLQISPARAQSSQPSPIVGVLRLSSINEIKTAAGAFAENIQPGSGAAAEQLPMMAAQLGIDAGGEILALLINPAQSSQPYGIVLPVTDPAGMAQNPAFGFQPATRPDVFKMTLPGMGQEMFAGFEGKKLILAPMEGNVELLKPLIRGDAIASSIAPLRSGGGQLALSISLEQLYMAYKPMIDMMMMGMRGQMRQGGADGAANPAAVMGMAESAVTMLGEVKGFGLRLSIEPNFFNLSAVLQAKPGSGLSKFLNLGSGPAAPSLSAFHPESAILGTLSMKPGADFFKAYNDMMTMIFDASGDPKAKAASEALAGFINDFAAVWDGTAAFAGMAPGQKGMMAGTYGITDAGRALDLIKRAPELQKSMSGLSAESGLETTATIEAESVEGPVTFVDVALNNKATGPAGEESLKGMKLMGMGEKIPTTYAVTARQIVYTMGSESRQAAKQIVMGAGGGAAVSPKDYGFPDNPNFFMAMSVPRLMNWLAATGAAPDLPKNLPAAAGKPGLAMMATGDGNGQLQLVMTAAEVKALMDLGNAAGGESGE